MTTTLPPELPSIDLSRPLAPDVAPARMTVEELQRSLERGLIESDNRTELLDGVLVLRDRGLGDGMPSGPEHVYSVETTREVLRELVTELPMHVRSEADAKASEWDMPIPDVSVVRGERRDYARRHPGREDVVLIVEVSDTSLARDRRYKARIYAEGGFTSYVIVNLRDRQVEVFEEPDVESGTYQKTRVAVEGDTVGVPVGGQTVQLVVADLLPPR